MGALEHGALRACMAEPRLARRRRMVAEPEDAPVEVRDAVAIAHGQPEAADADRGGVVAGSVAVGHRGLPGAGGRRQDRRPARYDARAEWRNSPSRPPVRAPVQVFPGGARRISAAAGRPRENPLPLRPVLLLGLPRRPPEAARMDAITLLVGTTKGAFLIEAGPARDAWRLRGPFCGGWPINHSAADPSTGRIWAGGGGDFHGAGIWRSEDGGASWRLAKLAWGQMDHWLAADPGMAAHFGLDPPSPAPFTGEVTAVWSLAHAGGVLYAGTKPAALYASRDGGAGWEPVGGLNGHPSRESWEPGAAGLVLHSIVADPADPARLWVGISAAGVFASEDGGLTWERRNRLSNAPAPEAPAPAPGHDHGGEVGLCVHCLVRAPAAQGSAPDLLYQQNHHGVFRSTDGGRSWDDISAGLPSRFGFPVAVHPHDPRTLWTLPLNGDIEGRYPPGAAAAVWKSTDGGASWTRHDAGLPARDCFFTVLRQAMATDRQRPAGVYFGTNSGSVFASRDEGETWDEIARHLPAVLSVEVLDHG
jgi:hypothetical protein